MNIWNVGKELSEKNESFVVATLIHVNVSAPQDDGNKMVVSKKGLYAGTMGGGKLELTTINKCLAILENPVQQLPEVIKWNMQRDIGMTCGGEVTILFEHFVGNPWPIAIFGAGHVAQALVHVLSPVNCHITCLDPRKEWLDKIKGATTIESSDPTSFIKAMPSHTFFISVTMGHDYDFAVLREVFLSHPDCTYIGCIGSEIKGKRMRAQLKEAGVSDEFIKKIRLPMGLPFGNNQPGEIAISIAAEILQLRDALKMSGSTL
jgi:xanthine dehydrogenase accessory factor